MNARTRAAALVALLALLTAALLALSAAQAGPPPDDVQLILRADDIDGIIEPGQEITVSAAVRFPGQYGGIDRMKASDFSLDSTLGWESVAGRTLDVDDLGFIMGGQILAPTNAAGVRLPGRTFAILQAMDGRTAVARAEQNPAANHLIIYDTWNKRQALLIPPPTGATNGFGASERRFPTSGTQTDDDRFYHGRAIAVWHQTETLAWLFIGEAKAEGPGGQQNVGRLYISSLDWSTNPPTYTQHGTLQPPLSEAGNHSTGTVSTHYWASYGSAVAISADGSTLAVGAPRMNNAGAVYVYTRPDGPGRDWTDITYDEGVKVTIAPVPHWGTSEATSSMPNAGCSTDPHCKTQRANQWTRLAWRYIGLSADGRVMAVGASGKSFYHDAPVTATYGGGGSGKWNFGEAYVFVAPDGGWQAAPDVVTGKTVIQAKTAAPSDYSANRDNYTTPGPKRRITSPTTYLRARTWAAAPNQNWRFGQLITITRDGTAVAVGTNPNPNQNSFSGKRSAFIFQVDSTERWKDVTDPWVAEADTVTSAHSIELWEFHGFGAPGWCGMAFNGDGTSLFAGSCGAPGGNDPGYLHHLLRPADGLWARGNVRAAGAYFTEPIGQRTGNAYGMPLYSLNGERLAVSALGIKIIDHFCCTGHSNFPGQAYFSDAGCYQHTDDNGAIWTTCPLDLGGNARIVVPPGEPEGPLNISARIKVFMFLGRAYSGQYTGLVGDDTANARTLSQSLELRIAAAAAELAQAKLDFAPRDDGGAWPSSLSSGERTVLRLQLLDQNGIQADGAAIASIIATTTRGSLSFNNEQNTNGCLGSGGGSCQIDPAQLTGADDQARLFVPTSATPSGMSANNQSRTSQAVASSSIGYSAANIRLTLTHNSAAGPADVSVRAIAKNGQSFSTEAVRVNLLGPPTALNIAAPAGGLLNIGTPDTGLDADNRDILTLAVTAVDQHGAKAPLPTGGSLRATLTDPDGKRVASGVALEWPLGGADTPTLNAAGDRQVRINVNRTAAQPLANGQYTLSLRLGALSAEQTLRVSGGVAAVALNPNSLDAPLDADFTVTATLTDAEGDPVPDGTAVEWTEIAAASGAAGIVQRSADRATTGGRASATYLAVSPGRITLTAASNGITAVTLVTVPAPPQPSIAELLTAASPNAFATWLGAQTIQAADLLPALEGVTTLATWRNGRWLRYGVAQGQLLPGSADFPIPRGAILWLSN